MVSLTDEVWLSVNESIILLFRQWLLYLVVVAKSGLGRFSIRRGRVFTREPSRAARTKRGIHLA